MTKKRGRRGRRQAQGPEEREQRITELEAELRRRGVLIEGLKQRMQGPKKELDGQKEIDVSGSRESVKKPAWERYLALLGIIGGLVYAIGFTSVGFLSKALGIPSVRQQMTYSDFVHKGLVSIYNLVGYILVGYLLIGFAWVVCWVIKWTVQKFHRLGGWITWVQQKAGEKLYRWSRRILLLIFSLSLLGFWIWLIVRTTDYADSIRLEGQCNAGAVREWKIKKQQENDLVGNTPSCEEADSSTNLLRMWQVWGLVVVVSLLVKGSLPLPEKTQWRWVISLFYVLVGWGILYSWSTSTTALSPMPLEKNSRPVRFSQKDYEESQRAKNQDFASLVDAGGNQDSEVYRLPFLSSKDYNLFVYRESPSDKLRVYVAKFDKLQFGRIEQYEMVSCPCSKQQKKSDAGGPPNSATTQCNTYPKPYGE